MRGYLRNWVMVVGKESGAVRSFRALNDFRIRATWSTGAESSGKTIERCQSITVNQ